MRKTWKQDNHGERHSHNKLTNADVFAIRAACAAGMRQGVVGAAHGVRQCNVSRIVNGKRWGHLTNMDAAGSSLSARV